MNFRVLRGQSPANIEVLRRTFAKVPGGLHRIPASRWGWGAIDRRTENTGKVGKVDHGVADSVAQQAGFGPSVGRSCSSLCIVFGKWMIWRQIEGRTAFVQTLLRFSSMKTHLTELTFILDRSGSMNHLVEAAIQGFNHFLREHQTASGLARLTLVLFDDEYLVPAQSLPVAEVVPLDARTYVPRNSTALLDAIGRSIDELGARLAATPEQTGQRKSSWPSSPMDWKMSRLDIVGKTSQTKSSIRPKSINGTFSSSARTRTLSPPPLR